MAAMRLDRSHDISVNASTNYDFNALTSRVKVVAPVRCVLLRLVPK
jgi:hypothetical protein